MRSQAGRGWATAVVATLVLANVASSRATVRPVSPWQDGLEQRIDRLEDEVEDLERRLLHESAQVNRLGREVQDVERDLRDALEFGGMLAFLAGVICALWAQNSDRSAWLWFFLGLFFHVITLVVMLVKNSGDRQREQSRQLRARPRG